MSDCYRRTATAPQNTFRPPAGCGDSEFHDGVIILSSAVVCSASSVSIGESRHFHSAFHDFMPAGGVSINSNSGKVGVVWRSPVIKNASLPESDSDVSPSQVDGTARTGQADTQAHHSRKGLTACVRTRVPARGILPPVGPARPTPRERKPRRLRRGGCHSFRRAF